MSLWSRIQVWFAAKTEAALDAAEDPRQTLEYAYQRQREMLRQVQQGLVEVATTRRQLELRAQKQRNLVPQLETQAQRALAANREDLARTTLQRKQTSLAELSQIEQQLQAVGEEERKLTQAQQQFAQQIEVFRARRENLSAQYTVAEAQVQLNETLGGVSHEFADLGLALERAEAKIERTQARAAALDGLLNSGTLLAPVGGDNVERELQVLSAGQAVEAELAALKAQTVLALPQPTANNP